MKQLAIMTDPWRHQFEWRGRTTLPIYKDYAPTVRATDYKGPALVLERW
ncbi:MAG: hypothetical protein KBT34_10605 [Prevotella sp.]|nr:hypothetical protein [Candidatus Prevotella equi]